MRSRPLTGFIAKLMFVIYFFALFSQTFHEHDFSDTLKSLHLKKADNSISKSDEKMDKGDCLACHFLVTGNTLMPEEFSLATIHHSQEAELIITAQEKIWAQTKFSFQLRGPPSIS